MPGIEITVDSKQISNRTNVEVLYNIFFNIIFIIILRSNDAFTLLIVFSILQVLFGQLWHLQKFLVLLPYSQHVE